MFGRPLVMTGLLGAAVAAPIAMTEGPEYFQNLSWPKQSAAPQQAEPNPTGPTLPEINASHFKRPDNSPPRGPGAEIYESPAPLEGVGVVSLGELLRLDVTKNWVYRRWDRKSTGLADPELFGIRAPVVTGTQMSDLAGSISYYFNRQDQVERLRFHGRTADTRPLVMLCAQQFGMKRVASRVAGEQLYQAYDGTGVVSELCTRPEAVLWATSPHSSFVVDLEVNRPGSGRYVQPPTLKLDLPPNNAAPSPTQVVQPPPPANSPPAEKASGGAGGGEIQHAQRPKFRWPN